jgi:hypothetical protein
MLKGIKAYLCLVQTVHVDIEEFQCGRKGERHKTHGKRGIRAFG